MAQGQRRNRVLVQGAQQALDQMKYEIANEVGITNQIQGGYWGDVPARYNGAVGGQMVRRMIQLAEQSLANGQVTPQQLAGPEFNQQGERGGQRQAPGQTPGTTGTPR